MTEEMFGNLHGELPSGALTLFVDALPPEPAAEAHDVIDERITLSTTVLLL